MRPSPKSSALATLALACLVAATAAGPAAAQAPVLAPEHAAAPPPHVVVAEFLGLTDEQREAWAAIREEARAAIAPLVEELRGQEEALHELLATPDPDPAAVGALVLAIRELRQAIRVEEQEAVAAFLALLDDEQRGKLARLRRAAPLCRVVPAFEALHLLARPY
ncbi:MAG TPA: periplasmic heavy metal sensor [Thermoanaerobaculia bacterium]|nr:periplasmic heavy metal sensor [Thermoanaerobaculia bacterium]